MVMDSIPLDNNYDTDICIGNMDIDTQNHIGNMDSNHYLKITEVLLLDYYRPNVLLSFSLTILRITRRLSIQTKIILLVDSFYFYERK